MYFNILIVNYEVIGFDLKGSFYKLNIHFFQLFVIYLLWKCNILLQECLSFETFECWLLFVIFDSDNYFLNFRTEFRRENVLEFLKDLYRSENLSMQGLGLEIDGPVGGKASGTHDLIIANEQTDKKNFSEKENKNWGISFSPFDISLCFGVYVLSAVILILVNILLK